MNNDDSLLSEVGLVYARNYFEVEEARTVFLKERNNVTQHLATVASEKLKQLDYGKPERRVFSYQSWIELYFDARAGDRPAPAQFGLSLYANPVDQEGGKVYGLHVNGWFVMSKDVFERIGKDSIALSDLSAADAYGEDLPLAHRYMKSHFAYATLLAVSFEDSLFRSNAIAEAVSTRVELLPKLYDWMLDAGWE